MLAESRPIETTTEDLARECLYRFLAAVVSGPYTGSWDQALDARNHRLLLDASALLRDSGETGSVDLDRPDAATACHAAVGRLVQELNSPPEKLRAEYDRIFGLVVPRECPPYETDYYPTSETFARSQQMADVAGFYRAFGIEPSRRSPERPDHLGLELEFMALVLLKRRLIPALTNSGPDLAEWTETCNQAQRTFFHDHLAWWVPSFAAGLRRKAGHGCYLALAEALAAWIPAECRRLEIPAVLRPVRPVLIERSEEQSGCATCPAGL